MKPLLLLATLLVLTIVGCGGGARDLVEDSVVQCDERVLFQHPPVDLTAIEQIIPMGRMAGEVGHVTPTDHSYFDQRLELEKQIDVFSPAEGIVISIERMALSIYLIYLSWFK